MGYSLSISSSQVAGPGANQSTVTATITMTATNVGYSGYGTSWGMSIGGHGFSGGGPSALNTDGTGSESWSHSESKIFDHSDTGTRGEISCYASFNGSGGWSPPYMEAGPSKQPALDYDRRPGNPSFASIYRSYDDMYVGVNGVSSPASGLTYYIERSQNGGGWGDQRASQATWYYDLPFGTTQQFRCLASNADGNNPGDWQYSGVYSIPNVPSAPSSIAATTPSALSSTISIGTSSNNGAGITAYYVQASPDNGTTWLSPQLMTNQSYTYNGLTPGATYKFRSYAVNEMGSGAYATTGSTFVPAGGKRWTGTAWQPTATAKRWNGTAWVDLTTAKRWSGSAWVDLT